jgi:hypothetical protein
LKNEAIAVEISLVDSGRNGSQQVEENSGFLGLVGFKAPLDAAGGRTRSFLYVE